MDWRLGWRISWFHGRQSKGLEGRGGGGGGLDQAWKLTLPGSEVESMERAAVAAAVAAVLGLYMREEAVRGVYYDEEDDEEEQVVLYAKELQWWEEHTMMGPEGVLVPREVVPEVIPEEVPEEVEAEGPVPISHPTSHTVDLLPDPALEESEEESDSEEDLRRWLERGRGKGVKRGWEWIKDPTEEGIEKEGGGGGVGNFLGGMGGEWGFRHHSEATQSTSGSQCSHRKSQCDRGGRQGDRPNCGWRCWQGGWQEGS